jgi:orotidine-5'-phosphate decarboxylase
MASFAQRLVDAVRTKGNPVCVGLDPRWGSLPEACHSSADDLESQAEAYSRFCCEIIDVVAPLVPIVKPQAAFFEQLGPHGMVALGKVLDRAREKGLMTILDGKRNDIGSTASPLGERTV